MAHYDYVLITNATSGGLCKALGIRLVTNPLVVQLAKNAGFDTLFIDLEHSTLSLSEASAISCAGLLSGLTPFVLVPYQCGMGLVQQVLDGGAMGVILPHIHSASYARAAVDMCKFPPRGRRSMWGQQPALGLQVRPLHNLVEGLDVLLVGCLDLPTDMGAPGAFETRVSREALEVVSAACQRHGRLMGLAGLYNNRELQDWAINTIKAHFMLCQQYSNVLAAGAMECAAAVAGVDGTVLPN
ncbi:2-keto-3-deoxy-L-rhamnonate aldolase [Cytospora mali]|uniref:2-keto-3-deoxy-L-rhamnonate aldolase n=1 Tax=Cytospora mali TaxID=578113 RepID=A0A194W7U4_CYTMA|nr:2-keto-3-deoxy-L-rhamnonate aldolase [Valsa mali]